jgi:predicted homoserine dehydrogenase-like protein
MTESVNPRDAARSTQEQSENPYLDIFRPYWLNTTETSLQVYVENLRRLATSQPEQKPLD